MNEADTCRTLVTPKLQAAGWDRDPHRINEQVTFTDGRIVVMGQQARRRPEKLHQDPADPVRGVPSVHRVVDQARGE